MVAKNIAIGQVKQALETINKKYDNNIVFKTLNELGHRVHFTLTVKNSRGKGGRIGHTGRRIAAACWHVHGTLFDEIFNICPDAVITACGNKITMNEGNWQDKNIGSQFQPLFYSEACDC